MVSCLCLSADGVAKILDKVSTRRTAIASITASEIQPSRKNEIVQAQCIASRGARKSIYNADGSEALSRHRHKIFGMRGHVPALRHMDTFGNAQQMQHSIERCEKIVKVGGRALDQIKILCPQREWLCISLHKEFYKLYSILNAATH